MIGHGAIHPDAWKANMHRHTQDIHMDMERYHIPQPHCGAATATTLVEILALILALS